MIEILILYIVHRREKTIYSIRKEIMEYFGIFTKPSIGTIYPALQRLLKEKAVSLNERLSDGGKKSSYYIITKSGFDYFKKLFFNSASDNPSLFYNHFQARLATMGMLDVEERKQFLSDFSKKLDLYQFEIEQKLNDEFMDFDYYQRQLFNRTLDEISSLREYIKHLKVD